MTLRIRLLKFFLPTLALVVLAVYLLAQYFLVGRFERQDHERLLEEATQLNAVLDFETARHLKIIVGDAWRESTLAFLASPSQAVLEKLASQNALENLDLDFVIFLDAEGRALDQRWSPHAMQQRPSLGRQIPSSLAALQHGIVRDALALIDTATANRAGMGRLIVSEGVPLLLVSSVIQPPSGQPGGIVLAGRLLDQRFMTQLQLLLQGELALLPPLNRVEDWSLLRDSGDLSGAILISPRDILGKKQRMQLLYSGHDGKAELRLAVTLPRRSYVGGQQAIGFFLGTFLVVGLCACLALYLGLNHAILQRIRRMNREVAGVVPGEHLPTLSDEGADELGQLASEVNHMFARLDQSEKRDQAILDSIQDGYFELDSQGMILKVNNALNRMFGMPAEAMLGHSYLGILQPQDRPRARLALHQCLYEPSRSIRFTAPLKRGRAGFSHFEVNISLIANKQGDFSGYRGILRDISEQAAHEHFLHDLAYRDALTGIGNRKAFHEQLQGLMDESNQEGSSLALLFIDLDHFKTVNDRFGHDVGDALLKAITERLRNVTRQPDRLFRLGGDEFTCLMTDASPNGAERLAQRMLDALGPPLRLGSVDIDFVTLSIGIALFPLHAADANSLIKAADYAMYQAKQERNKVCLFSRATLPSAKQNQ